MTITRRLMKPGAFSVKLRPDTPWDVYGDTINRFDQIVVTANRLLPIEAFSNANILASSIFTGVITKEVTSDQLEGHGLDWYLGTPDGYGVGTGSSSSTQGLITTPISQTAATLSAWITALCPPALAVGTVNNSGLSTLTNTYQGLTRREAATSVCTILGAEYRVNNTGTIDAATPANLFGATPSAIITRNKDARDAGLYGIESTGISLTIDVDDYISSAIVVTKGTGVAATATRVDGTAGFRDFAGNPMYVERYIDAPDGLAANASLIAAAALAKFNAERKDLRLSSNTYSVTRFVEPGDYVWVWDQELGLVDSANQVQFRGGVVQPLLLRVMGLTFPIEEGMGVYVRHATGAGTYTYTDITDSVQFETSATVWEVGAPRRIYAGGIPAVGTAATLGVNPEISARMAAVTVPGVRARASAATSVANNTNTYLGWDTEDYDTDSFHDTATNNSRLTVPTGRAGTYLVGFSVLFAAATQTTSAWIEVNRGATRFAWAQTPNDATNGTLLCGTDFLHLAAGDYVEVRVFQNSGAALNVAGNANCSAWMTRIGD